MFGSKEYISSIRLGESYKAKPLMLLVDEMGSDVVTKMQGLRRTDSWPLIHQLLKPVYGFPGIKDGTEVLLISSRDVKFDPTNKLGEAWSKDNIKKQMVETAKEQQHKVEESNNQSALGRAGVWLAVSAFILVLGIVTIGIMKYYGA